VTMSDGVSEYVDALESLILGFAHGTRAVLQKHHLTAVQFLVLQWVSTEGPGSMSAVAAFLGVRPQSVTPVVDSLVRRGWIRRKRSRADRRQTRLELSPEALRLMAVFRRAHLRRLRKALRKMPPESLRQATAALRISERALADSLRGPLSTPREGVARGRPVGLAGRSRLVPRGSP
jgi:DNA-binding MarR family transcriptional regulator